MKQEITQLSELKEVASSILEAHPTKRIFLFNAPMGAGKTTLIKELCKELGVTENISSPTFGIVNEYDSPSGPIFHFDCYRMEKPEEAFDIGFSEYIESGCYCFIEWPEIIQYFLPEEDKYVAIHIFVKEGKRTFEY